MDIDALLIPMKLKLVRSKLVNEQNLEKHSIDTNEIDRFENDKLIDLIKNFRHYGLKLADKNNALKVLHNRGITELELKLSGT